MSPLVRVVCLAVQAYVRRPGNVAGGCLHIVLDDFNTTDQDLRFCLDYAREHDDPDGEALAWAMLALSVPERDAVARLRFGSDEELGS